MLLLDQENTEIETMYVDEPQVDLIQIGQRLDVLVLCDFLTKIKKESERLIGTP